VRRDEPGAPARQPAGGGADRGPQPRAHGPAGPPQPGIDFAPLYGELLASGRSRWVCLALGRGATAGRGMVRAEELAPGRMGGVWPLEAAAAAERSACVPGVLPLEEPLPLSPLDGGGAAPLVGRRTTASREKRKALQSDRP
jgi:hypothetical protein